MQWDKEFNFSCNVDRELVTSTDSLTQRLRAQSSNFAVKVLHESLCKPLADEVQYFNLDENTSVYVREVFLMLEGKAVVFARSVLPASSSELFIATFRGLATTALGTVLFSEDNGFVRSALEFCLLSEDVNSGLQQRLSQYQEQNDSLVARRSCFHRKQDNLLIYEVFLS